jgi:hypothetical protein
MYLWVVSPTLLTFYQYNQTRAATVAAVAAVVKPELMSL